MAAIDHEIAVFRATTGVEDIVYSLMYKIRVSAQHDQKTHARKACADLFAELEKVPNEDNRQRLRDLVVKLEISHGAWK